VVTGWRHRRRLASRCLVWEAGRFAGAGGRRASFGRLRRRPDSVGPRESLESRVDSSRSEAGQSGHEDETGPPVSCAPANDLASAGWPDAGISTRSSAVGSRRTDLSQARLAGAKLIGADLRGANLRLAILHGADLRGANLRGVDLEGADLTGAQLGPLEDDASV
jgi:Pentapeptide repeats (8 copies)